MNEMCMSTGFMNGVRSLFVPNLCLDHDDNVAVAKWPHRQKTFVFMVYTGIFQHRKD